MASSHPVVMIHAAPWCVSCKKFLSPDNLDKITKHIKTINPNTEIKIIYHKDFKDTNKTEEYPPFNYIPAFPTMMVTSSANCNRKGSISKVEMLGYKWNGNAIVKGTSESMEAFLSRTLRSPSIGGGNSPSIINEVTKPFIGTTTGGDRVKTDRRERSFRLVGVSND